jgi:hypothetical protein
MNLRWVQYQQVTKKPSWGGGLGLLQVRVLVDFNLRQAQITILPGWTERWDDERGVTSGSKLLLPYWAGLYHAEVELSRNLTGIRQESKYGLIF